MEFEYKGANCVTIKTKNNLIITDPTDNVKVKGLDNKEAIVLATQAKFAPTDIKAFAIDMPGEFEHRDVMIQGIQSHIHTDKDGKNSIMYRIKLDGVRIAVIGHTDAPLSDEQLESLGMIDVLIIPVGGGGYTLDARDATTVVRQVEPKIVIPTHYDDGTTKYEVPQESVENFVKELGGQHEKQTTLKIKNAAALPAALTLYELTRTA
jgi:L-ascorbate metabolism protein UlaG (beta-lactamase superfamily)